MIYYHGRGKSRPYYGNYIYITSSFDYAVLYAQEGYVYECELICDKRKIFSIKNSEHLLLLKPLLSKEIIDRFNVNEEIPWEQLSYLCNQQFEEPEDLLMSLGFKGVCLKERANVESLYIFNQEDVSLGKKIKV